MSPDVGEVGFPWELVCSNMCENDRVLVCEPILQIQLYNQLRYNYTPMTSFSLCALPAIYADSETNYLKNLLVPITNGNITLMFSTLVKVVPAFRVNDLPISVTTWYFPLNSSGA